MLLNFETIVVHSLFLIEDLFLEKLILIVKNFQTLFVINKSKINLNIMIAKSKMKSKYFCSYNELSKFYLHFFNQKKVDIKSTKSVFLCPLLLNHLQEKRDCINKNNINKIFSIRYPIIHYFYSIFTSLFLSYLK